MNKPKQEEWKSVVGWHGFYEVSSIGRVKSIARIVDARWGKAQLREKILSNRVAATGYFQVVLFRGSVRHARYVARLVAMAFLPSVNGETEVNHINGIKSDNRVENLEWITHGDNVRHAFATGLVPIKRGPECPAFKHGGYCGQSAKRKRWSPK